MHCGGCLRSKIGSDLLNIGDTVPGVDIVLSNRLEINGISFNTFKSGALPFKFQIRIMQDQGSKRSTI